MIEKAAIRKNGIIYTGKRHHIILANAKEYGLEWDGLKDGEQGFVTKDGKFVDRKEAAEIAYKSGQIRKKVRILFSEDLY